jgi:hypothetical protein
LLWALLSSVVVLFGAAVAAQLEAIRAGKPSPRDPVRRAESLVSSPTLEGSGLVRGNA